MSIRVHRHGGVVDVVIDRPEKRNAMTDAMWAQLETILADIDPTRDRVLVLSGSGGAFCGGSDVGGFLEDPEGLRERIEVSNRCILGVHELDFPVIAKVDGIAAGSGANLALASDFVIASSRARFAQLFIRIGLSVDSGASWLLPRLVGERRARELALLGDDVMADEALAFGLVTRVVPKAQLDDEVAGLAARLCDLAPEGLAGTKRLLARTWQRGLAEALDAEADNQCEVISSDAAQRAIRAFTERRRSDPST